MSVANYIFLYNSADRPLVWLLPFAFFETNKAGNKISWGMSGKEADPAALFRLYINYGRHAEATNAGGVFRAVRIIGNGSTD